MESGPSSHSEVTNTVPEKECSLIEGAKCDTYPRCRMCINYPSSHDVQRARVGQEERMSGIYEGEIVPPVEAFLQYEGEVAGRMSASKPSFHSASRGGMKFDGGKLRAGIAERTIPHLMRMIDRVLDYGAQKYDEGSWPTVPDAMRRYHDAANRHRLKVNLARIDGINQENFFDEETGLPHRVGVIINEIFQLGLEVAEYNEGASSRHDLTVEQVYNAYAPVREEAIRKAQALKGNK
jgi:hypothetical protein